MVAQWVLSQLNKARLIYDMREVPYSFIYHSPPERVAEDQG